MKKKLMIVNENDYPNLREKLSSFEKDYLEAIDNHTKLRHENADWGRINMAKVKQESMMRRFWDFKEKTNHLPLGWKSSME